MGRIEYTKTMTRQPPIKGGEGHEMLTVRDVANAFRVCDRTVRNWIKDKKLIAVKEGRLIRIPKSSMNDFIQKRLEP